VRILASGGLRRCKSSRYPRYRCGLRLASHPEARRAHPRETHSALP